MIRVLRWLGFGLAVAAGLAVIAAVTVYVASERILRRAYAVPPATLTVPGDARSIAEGRRLALVNGCYSGCHGSTVEGSVMFDDPLIARIVAPDLTAAVRHYSDGEFATIVRHGLRPDGRSVLIMPSEAYAPMTDGDLVRILAFLRSLPPANGLAPAVRVGPLGRLGLVSGKFRTTAQRFEAHQAPTPARDSLGSQGRYLAQVACGHCHGRDLHGTSNPSFTSPDLRAVAAYSPDTFATLIRTGQALGGRELGTMSPWARSNLSYLTEDEVAALYAYLSAMARE